MVAVPIADTALVVRIELQTWQRWRAIWAVGTRRVPEWVRGLLAILLSKACRKDGARHGVATAAIRSCCGDDPIHWDEKWIGSRWSGAASIIDV